MTCVDTSVWIAAQRGFDMALFEALRGLLRRQRVLLPVVVRIELLAGTPQARQSRVLRNLEAIPVARPETATWDRVERWAVAGAAAGHRFGIPDLLIAALAAERGAAVWTLDRDFERMAELGWVQLHRPAGGLN